MFHKSILQTDEPADPITWITYTYIFGSSWEECGVSIVDGYLSALGFYTAEEVAKFCDFTNVLKSFSTEDWAKRHANSEDRKIIEKFGKAPSSQSLVSGVLLPLTSLDIDRTPYADFFQTLFTWVTGGDSAERRAGFIKNWETPAGKPSSVSGRNAYAKYTDTLSCRLSFKTAVDAFLKDLRTPKKSRLDKFIAENSGVIVDLVHAVRVHTLETALQLKPANWGYISGMGAGASIGLGEFISAGGSTSTFAVYEKSLSKKVYPLQLGSINAGLGAGLSLPVSVTVDPEEFPSKGTIFHGLGQPISGINSFCGPCIAIGGAISAAIFNLTTSLLVISNKATLPGVLTNVSAPMLQNADLLEKIIRVLISSTAILQLDGHGIEVALGSSLQLSCGAVFPQKQKNKNQI